MAAAWLAAAAVAQLIWQGNSASLRAVQARNEGFFTYDYSHRGQDWIMGTCASRSRQSPIDFSDLTSPATGKLSFLYSVFPGEFEFYNNGHAYTADMTGLGYGGITYEDAYYNLVTINVHAQAEHTFEGKRFPLELHLVHKRTDSESLLTVAIPISSMTQPMAFPGQFPGMTTTPGLMTTPMFGMPTTTPGFGLFTTTPVPGVYYPPVKGELNFNPVLQTFLRVEPPPVHMKVVPPLVSTEPLDLNTLMEGGTFLEYAGSMTAPPCAEIVTWMVRREPIMASDTQVRILYEAIYKSTGQYGNWREIMPMNGREIAVRKAVKEEPIPQADNVPFPKALSQHTDREFRTMKWAKDAELVAKSAADYVKDLDQRLQRASLVNGEAYRQYLWTTTPLPAWGNYGSSTTTMTTTGMSDAAVAMAQQISAVAKQAVASAVQQINVEARYAAIRAATDAMRSVHAPTGPWKFNPAPVAPQGYTAGPYGSTGPPNVMGPTVPAAATIAPSVIR